MTDAESDIATLNASNPRAASGLSDQQLLEMYRQMVLCRTLDERIWQLNRQGKAAIVADVQQSFELHFPRRRKVISSFQ